MTNPDVSPRAGLSPRNAGLFILGLLLVFLCSLLWAVEKPRRDAARVLREVSQLQIGKTPYSQVMQLVSQYSADSACYDQDCSFLFQNQWLHRLGIAPVTQLHVILHRRESQLAGINMAMIVVGASLQTPPRASAMVFDHPGSSPSEPAWRAVVTNDAKGQPVKIFVQISPEASADQRRQAFNFNLNCLTKWGGCRTSRDLLPEASKNATQVEWVE